jgi:hypothetical protein
MVPPINSANGCVSVGLLAAFLYLIFVEFIEHQCRRIVQQDHDNGGFEATHYNSGIGTYAKPWKSVKYPLQLVDNTVDLAIAW